MTQFAQYVVDGLVLGGLYGLIALGYTMVYGVIQLINFAHGEIFMVGAFGGVGVYDVLPSSTPTALALPVVLVSAILSSAIVALLMERLAYRPLRNAPRLAPLITAIGVSIFLQQVVRQYVPDSSLHSYPALFPSGGFTLFGVDLRWVELFILVVALVLMFGLRAFVLSSRTGRAMRATAQDPDTARMLGVDTDRIIVITFLLGAALAGVAGTLQGMYVNSIAFNMGYVAGLKAFTAAVLGGIGNITGALLGGLTLGVVESLATGYLPDGSEYKDVWAFVVLVGVLLFRPTGLLGESVRTRA